MTYRQLFTIAAFALAPTILLADNMPGERVSEPEMAGTFETDAPISMDELIELRRTEPLFSSNQTIPETNDTERYTTLRFGGQDYLRFELCTADKGYFIFQQTISINNQDLDRINKERGGDYFAEQATTSVLESRKFFIEVASSYHGSLLQSIFDTNTRALPLTEHPDLDAFFETVTKKSDELATHDEDIDFRHGYVMEGYKPPSWQNFC
ncbi:MAG: hypothetical protein AAF988_00900 [Pseudomonadota bacterium]